VFDEWNKGELQVGLSRRDSHLLMVLCALTLLAGCGSAMSSMTSLHVPQSEEPLRLVVRMDLVLLVMNLARAFFF